MTPEDAVHGDAVPVSKPGLPSFWPVLVQPEPPPEALTVQVKDVWPEAVPEVAVTVTLAVPAVVGVPEIRPVDEIDRPAGRPVAE